MTRALALLLLALVILMWAQRAWLAFTRTPTGRGVLAAWRGLAHPSPAAAEARRPEPQREEPLRLVRCTSCGVHVPEAEALGDGRSAARAQPPLCGRCRETRSRS